jgi:hypothetical protein
MDRVKKLVTATPPARLAVALTATELVHQLGGAPFEANAGFVRRAQGGVGRPAEAASLLSA